MEQTRKVNAQTDIRTDGGHDIIRPVLDGRIKGNAPLQNCQNFGSFQSYDVPCMDAVVSEVFESDVLLSFEQN